MGTAINNTANTVNPVRNISAGAQSSVGPQSPTGILSHGQVPGQTAGMASAQRARQGVLDGLSMVPRGGDTDMLGATAEIFKNAISSGAMMNLNKTSDLYGGLNKYEAIAQRNLYGAPGSSPREGLGLTYPAGVAGGNSQYSNNGGSDYGNVSTQSSQYNAPSSYDNQYNTPSTTPSQMNDEAYSSPYQLEDGRRN